ncbi:MAG TPA: YbhB/YbcL family Raf kinase inhibitor-like protein [Candidatus Angelobacter sp.]|nr:YbhB/YbcL family Raf kinase inhibitor-like protein [Candidatus Angelobacter sp.]
MNRLQRTRRFVYGLLCLAFFVGLVTPGFARHPKTKRSSMLQLTSKAFKNEAEIPTEFSCDGQNISPELAWSGAPAETKSLALIMHDPDAPMSGGFTHWLVYNIPANIDRLPQDVPHQDQLPGGGIQGKNSSGKYGYIGPCPPSGTHRYYFKLYALDVILNPSAGTSKENLERAIRGHVLAETELMGKYKRVSNQAA